MGGILFFIHLLVHHTYLGPMLLQSRWQDHADVSIVTSNEYRDYAIPYILLIPHSTVVVIFLAYHLTIKSSLTVLDFTA